MKFFFVSDVQEVFAIALMDPTPSPDRARSSDDPAKSEAGERYGRYQPVGRPLV
jgi:hypothetical protein